MVNVPFKIEIIGRLSSSVVDAVVSKSKVGVLILLDWLEIQNLCLGVGWQTMTFFCWGKAEPYPCWSNRFLIEEHSISNSCFDDYLLANNVFLPSSPSVHWLWSWLWELSFHGWAWASISVANRVCYWEVAIIGEIWGWYCLSDWLRKTDTEGQHPFDCIVYISSVLSAGLGYLSLICFGLALI